MPAYYIGIDIGGTNTRVALLTDRFSIVKKVSFPTRSFKGPKRLLAEIAGSVRKILKVRKLPKDKIRGIGIGIAGLVNTGKGTVHNLINIPGWRGINIKRFFENGLGIRVYVDNDVNVMTLAELHRGAGRGDKNLICITLGTGVGGGIVIDGKLYRGSTSSAGEIGHIPINEKGPKCNCGGVACIESYVGGAYLVKELKRIIKARRKTVLMKASKEGLALTPELVYKAASLGDKLAIDFWKRAGTRIGILLTGIINFLDPDKIIIGGGIADAGNFLFPAIKDVIKERAMELQRRHTKLVRAKLGRDAGLVGAAILADIERDK